MFQGSEELFAMEPLPARSPTFDDNVHTSAAFISRPHTPMPAGSRTDRTRERMEEDLVAAEAEVKLS